MDLRLILNPVEPSCAPSSPNNVKQFASKQPVPLEPPSFNSTYSPFGSFPMMFGAYRLPTPPPQSVRYAGFSPIAHSNSDSHHHFRHEKRRSSASKFSRRCISCRHVVNNMWRPSWIGASGKLCNSCGLRYYRRRIRCTNASCELVPRNVDLALRVNPCVGSTCPRCNYALTIDKK